MPVLMSIQTGAPCKWTIDGKHFILDNFDKIRESPSEIYNTALALCPSTSWLHKHHPTKAARFKMVVGPTGWGTCICTVPCPVITNTLAYRKNTIATCTSKKDIVMYDTLTGSQTAILSGHSDYVHSLAFSLDGTLLVSGGNDKTIKLWDVQTGGVTRTLYGHTDLVISVTISADGTMIASGTQDGAIFLWSIETGNCLAVWRHGREVRTVSFSPTNSQVLLSSGDSTVQHWSIDGHQICSPIAGSDVAFSPDGTQFVSYMGRTVTSRDTDSKKTVMQFDVARDTYYCSFSPDGRFIVVVSLHTIDLWDISSPKPCLFQTLIGHTGRISCLTFLSPLILVSASMDCTIKFWQIDSSLTSPSTSGLESPLPTSIPIKAVSLQVKDGLAFSIDSEGVVKIWDILTGLCKESIITPAKDIFYGDMQVTSRGLVVSWRMEQDNSVYIWNAQQDKVQNTGLKLLYGGLRISEDGSRVFCVDYRKMQSWSMETQKHIRIDSDVCWRFLDPLRMNNSKILAYTHGLSTEVWDFGPPGSTCIQLSELSLDRPLLKLTDIRTWLHGSLVWIEDSVTGKVIFQLYGKYKHPSALQWNGQYLIAGYTSGEVLILNFGQMLTK